MHVPLSRRPHTSFFPFPLTAKAPGAIQLLQAGVLAE